jgi:hypothetical protein
MLLTFITNRLNSINAITNEKKKKGIKKLILNFQVLKFRSEGIESLRFVNTLHTHANEFTNPTIKTTIDNGKT